MAEVPATRKPQDPSVRRSAELEELILDRIAAGDSLREVCDAEDMPSPQAVRKWAVTDPIFGERFKIARMIQAHEFFDLMREEMDREVERGDDGKVDTGDVNLRRLRIDTYKWALAKMLPKVYGDTLKLQGDPDAPIALLSDEQVMEKIMTLLATAKSRQLRSVNGHVSDQELLS